jgi:hypothetical protein
LEKRLEHIPWVKTHGYSREAPAGAGNPGLSFKSTMIFRQKRKEQKQGDTP